MGRRQGKISVQIDSRAVTARRGRCPILSPKSIFGVSVVVAVRVGHRHYQPVDFGVGRFVFPVAKLFNKTLNEVD